MSDAQTDITEQLKKLQRVQRWALKSEAAPRINAMIALAQSDDGIPVLPRDLDRDPYCCESFATPA